MLPVLLLASMLPPCGEMTSVYEALQHLGFYQGVYLPYDEGELELLVNEKTREWVIVESDDTKTCVIKQGWGYSSHL